MSDYIGTRKQVDEYVGSRLVEAAYLGSRKYYDAYSEVSGSLPLVYESRVEHVLKNYVLYGTASGAGVETENLCDCTTFAAGNLDGDGTVIRVSNTTYVNGLPDGSIEFTTNQAWCGVHTEKFLIPTGAAKIRFMYSGSYVNNQYRFCFYDSNGDFIISSTQSGGNSFTVTIPDSAASVAIGIQLSTATTYKFKKLRLYTDLDTVTAFVPYGYQIPLTNTDGTHTATYPLYIGSTKLGEEEYLDYEDGKVYKRTAQLLNQNAKNTNNGYMSGRFLNSNGGSSANSALSVSEYIAIEENTVYTVQIGASYSLPSICFYDTNKAFISSVKYNGNKTLRVTSPADAAYARMSFRTATTNALNKGSAAIDINTRYIVPTDPPVPFPAITAYQGENTLSSTETVGPVTVKGRINEPPA